MKSNECERLAFRRKSVYGFSLIELLVVLAIMSVLASVALPVAELTQRRTKEYRLQLALRQIRDAIDAYKRASDEGRVLRRVGESGYPPDLNVLVTGVEDRKSPAHNKLYFLRRIPADPFAARVNTGSAVSWGLRSYASAPQNPQPGADVFDIYSRSEERGINGIPYARW